MRSSVAVRWLLLAVAGLLVAVAVAVAASKLTSQRIGLASEPLEAGRALAPPEPRGAVDRTRRRGDRHGETTTTTTTAPTSTSTTPTAAPPAADDSASSTDSGEEEADDDD